jgi:hypothetical protein
MTALEEGHSGGNGKLKGQKCDIIVPFKVVVGQQMSNTAGNVSIWGELTKANLRCGESLGLL